MSSSALKDSSSVRPLDKWRIKDEFRRFGDTVRKITSPWTTRKPNAQCPILRRIAWQPEMLEVVFKYERKMIFSSGVMASAENNRPRLPFMFFFIPLIFTEFVTILSQIDLVAFTKASKLALFASPGATFCLHTMNAGCNTACLQKRFRAAGTAIQSPAICISGRVASIAA